MDGIAVVMGFIAVVFFPLMTLGEENSFVFIACWYSFFVAIFLKMWLGDKYAEWKEKNHQD